MNFGDKLRELRQAKGLTQPELARDMGIEQSYLSKLENGKSLPSNDMLQRLLGALDLALGELLEGLDDGTRSQMRQIPDVAAHLNHQRQQLIGHRRRWLVISALLVALGIGGMYAGMENVFVPNIVYQYVSEGVVHDGESREIFREPRFPRGASPQEIERLQNDLYARRDEAYLQATDFRGSVFNVPVEGGSRTWYLQGEMEVDPWQNKVITLLGLVMAVLGLIGLLLDFRLARP
jgi:transcriptional regulator with XRE-family HTH domain